jgi:mannose-6-phosphate isomerase-like protein (cupin superfamily)
MDTSIRRVVTGHNANGKSIVLLDDRLEVEHDRYIWTTTTTPADNRDTADAAQKPLRLEPAANGSVFRVVQFPPESAMAGLSAAEKRKYIDDLFASMDGSHCRVDTSRSPGMHKTSTVDYIIVLRGEVTLVLDEGEVTLKPGDCVVQRGTNHDWVVRGSEPVLLGGVMISAHPV